MRLALSQVTPTDGDIESAFDHARAALEAAAAAGAKLLVLPELYLPGYNRPDLHARLAQPRDGTWLERMRDMARKAGCGVAFGWAERDGESVYNAASVLDDQGAVLAHYRKLQLFGPMERDSFQFGAEPPPVFDLFGRRTSILICYDVEFAPHVAALADRGVDLLLVPTANPAGYEHVQEVLVPARAYEGRMSIVYANYCGSERELAFGGLSLIAGPNARPLAKAGTTPCLLIADVPDASGYPPDTLSSLSTDYRPLG